MLFLSSQNQTTTITPTGIFAYNVADQIIEKYFIYPDILGKFSFEG